MADVTLNIGPKYQAGIQLLREKVLAARKKDPKALLEVEFTDEAYPNLDVSVYMKAKDLYLRAFTNVHGTYAFEDCPSEDVLKLGTVVKIPAKTDYHELGAWDPSNKITRWQAPKSIGTLAHWAPKSAKKADFLATEKATFACVCFMVSEAARFRSIADLIAKCFASDSSLEALELKDKKHVVTNWSSTTGSNPDVAVPWEK